MKNGLVLLALFALFNVAVAQDHHPRDPQAYIKRLDSEERAKQLQVPKVIETLKLTAGQRVADIGAGSGLFSRPLAEAVGREGVVYAVDIEPAMLKYIDKTAQERKLANLRTVLAAEDDPKLPEPVDLIVIINTLHHIAHQDVYLKKLRGHLRPGGRIAVIDFTDRWPTGALNMKYTQEELAAWMKGAEFTLREKHDFLNNNFFVIYGR
ncbi:MAG: class I SAM-dependent methyltransferase [Blastocatellia bacterium]|nr:class I SAM-dependent methyltransferase [Blastocatellia bacterium]